MKKFVFAFATLALAAASAGNRHKLNLYQPAEVNGQVLKPGEYTLEVKDNHAVIKGGRQTVEAEVRVENEAKKFDGNVVRFSDAGPNAHIEEIRIGGTTTKVVFGKGQAAGN